jgi:co-chaperonin GroES (HSP10)
MSTLLEEAFPVADPGVKPLGSRILVQIRTPETKSKGGIILSTNDQDTQMWNTTVAKVLAVGPLAFKNRNTQEMWPEGAWCAAGDFVRVPKYGGDRWVSTNSDDQKAYYILINDLDVLAAVTTDPTEIKAFF